jgi:hypothetical protein
LSYFCGRPKADQSFKLGSRSDDALREVAKYLDELSAQIELFEVYRKSLDLDPDLLERFFGLLVDLVLAAAKAIKYFRKHDISLSSWNHVNKEFSQSLQDFAARIEHLRKLVEAHKLTEMSLKQDEMVQSLSKYNLQSNIQREAAGLPYYQLPFARNPAFFGRTSLLGEVHRVLETSSAGRSLRSVALWGTGGIGKSQIALEYANTQIQANCQLVLWIPAQTETDISRALVHAANQVRPPGYEEKFSAERIRFLMWNWLQTTGEYLSESTTCISLMKNRNLMAHHL